MPLQEQFYYIASSDFFAVKINHWDKVPAANTYILHFVLNKQYSTSNRLQGP